MIAWQFELWSWQVERLCEKCNLESCPSAIAVVFLQVQHCSVIFSTVFAACNLIKCQNFAEAQITQPQFRGDGFLRRLIPISLSANQRLEIAMRLSIAHSSTLSNATLFYAFSDNEINPSVKMDLVNQTAIRLTLVCGAGSPPLALTVQRPNAAPSSAGEDFTTITFRWVGNQREIFSFEHQSPWELSHNFDDHMIGSE